MLVSIMQYNELIFLTFQNDHHNKSSYHLLWYKDIASLLTIFPTQCVSYLWLIYFATKSLYINLPHQFLSSPTPPVSLLATTYLSLYLWLFPCCYVGLLLGFLDLTYKWDYTAFAFIVSVLRSIILSKFVYPGYCKRQHFILLMTG